jgi:hypothetical protein
MEKKSTVRRKLYTAMFKLEVVDFATMRLRTMNYILHFTLYSCICDKIPVKAELQKMKLNSEIMFSNYRNLFSRYTLLYIIVYIGM